MQWNVCYVIHFPVIVKFHLTSTVLLQHPCAAESDGVCWCSVISIYINSERTEINFNVMLMNSKIAKYSSVISSHFKGFEWCLECTPKRPKCNSDCVAFEFYGSQVCSEIQFYHSCIVAVLWQSDWNEFICVKFLTLQKILIFFLDFHNFRFILRLRLLIELGLGLGSWMIWMCIRHDWVSSSKKDRLQNVMSAWC